MQPTRALINLDALITNLRVIKNSAGSRTIMAVVKANAYGHGAIPVAHRLAEEGIRDFAVATVPEGVELRNAGIAGSILVFGAVQPSDFQILEHHDLDLTASSSAIMDALAATSRRLAVHINVDTGMTRLGLSAQSAMDALSLVQARTNLRLAGLYTHLTAADRPEHPIAIEQAARWKSFLGDLGGRPCPIHVVSSGGIMVNPGAQAETDVVRAGIALYGLYQIPGTSGPGEFEPVMRLVSRVARVSHVKKGTPVSYGATWVAPEDTRIITVAGGYADGYPRRLSNKGLVGINGNLLPIVGTVCMDMMMVHLAAPNATVSVGDEVVLFGEGGPRCADLAKWAETITYEIACGISARVPRV